MFCRLSRSLLPAILLASLLAGSVQAASPVLLTEYNAHGFDAMILSALGYNSANVVYYKDFASVTVSQNEKRKQYESVGCYPFDVLKDGERAESGYDCQSFVCFGYERGPKQCFLADGKPYGGVVEISRRLGMTYISAKPKNFADFDVEDQTAAMKTKIASMEKIKCQPFYLMMFDVAVGEGYSCEEIGQFPRFSGANDCVDDWRTDEGLTCRLPEREGELALRQSIMETVYGVDFAEASSSSSSSASGASLAKTSFPDVITGRYGYTAIMDLAARGIVRGYPDGTFHPENNVNRAEFMKLLIAGLYDARLDDPGQCFPDVGDEWFNPYVCTGKRLGWLVGYADGHFRPNRSITKGEAMKVVVAASDLPMESNVPLPPGVPEAAWFAPYVRVAVEHGVLLEKSFEGTDNATRADVAVWIYRARNAKAKEAM